MNFKSSFQILAALLSKCSQLVGLWLGVKRFFTSACGLCLSHNWYKLFAYRVLYGTWVPNGCVDYILCTTN